MEMGVNPGRRLFLLGVLTMTCEIWSEPPIQAQVTAAGGPKQILIIRHGEKPGDSMMDDDLVDTHLATKGYERAGALAPFIPATFGAPDFLFATLASPKSNRPVETITPLAATLKLAINSTYADQEYKSLANEILTNPNYAGKRILICWHHGKIPELAHALGVEPKPEKWKGSVFDRVFRIDYANGKATLTDTPQMLLFGDTRN